MSDNEVDREVSPSRQRSGSTRSELGFQLEISFLRFEGWGFEDDELWLSCRLSSLLVIPDPGSVRPNPILIPYPDPIRLPSSLRLGSPPSDVDRTAFAGDLVIRLPDPLISLFIWPAHLMIARTGASAASWRCDRSS